MTKELEALENIKHYDNRVGLHEDDYKIIETALKRLETLDEETQKKLKALEIIKEKVMPLVSLDDGELYMHTELTKEQYDLLKEVLL